MKAPRALPAERLFDIFDEVNQFTKNGDQVYSDAVFLRRMILDSGTVDMDGNFNLSLCSAIVAVRSTAESRHAHSRCSAQFVASYQVTDSIYGGVSFAKFKI